VLQNHRNYQQKKKQKNCKDNDQPNRYGRTRLYDVSQNIGVYQQHKEVYDVDIEGYIRPQVPESTPPIAYIGLLENLITHFGSTLLT
jgi:hypothetical protein